MQTLTVKELQQLCMADKRIAISEENRDWLKGLKRGDDTYDDVLDDLRNEDYERAEASVSITPELDEDRVDEMVAELEARLSDVDVDVDAESIAAEIIDQMPALTYDDVVAANRKALREELPEGALR